MYGGRKVQQAHPIGVEQYLDLFDGAAIDMQLSNSTKKEDLISKCD